MKYPQIEVEIKLPNGAKIGMLKIFSEIGLVKDSEMYVKKVLEECIYSCINRVFMSGIYQIGEEVKKNK